MILLIVLDAGVFLIDDKFEKIIDGHLKEVGNPMDPTIISQTDKLEALVKAPLKPDYHHNYPSEPPILRVVQTTFDW